VKPGLEDTLVLMRDLRARCDWDAAQTHESLRPYVIEEAFEVDDAIRSGDDGALREELGDLLLQVLFHSVVAEERGAFDAGDVADTLIKKMKARHPHLYEPGGVKLPWEQGKAKRRVSIADGLPVTLPSLHRAFRLQERAAAVGFDWPDTAGPAQKVEEELREVLVELTGGAGHDSLAGSTPPRQTPAAQARDARRSDPAPASAIEDELGDLLFAAVNLCRKAGVHPALALDRANAKFARRFAAVERMAASRNIPVGTASLAELDALWDAVKAEEQRASVGGPV